MNKWMIAFALLAFAGCKKKGNDAMAKMESFQKQMCECKDKACADKVQDEMTKWAADAAKMAKPDESDPEMAKKSGEVMAKYTECMTKASGMGMGGDMHGGDMKGGDDMKGGGDMKGGDMKGGDMKGGDTKGGDMKGGDMKGGDMKGGDMKGGDMKGGDMKGGMGDKK
jgi:hypothetical protein